MTAADLRERFRAIPKEDRERRQDFAIRVWRALSWLERAEQFESTDWEGRFISGWICFNALYGRQTDGHYEGDHESIGVFLTRFWNIDREGRFPGL